MNTLIIYAHPNPRSFNRAILDTVEAALTRRGFTFLHPELRPALVQAAAVAARQLEVERQVTFTQVDASTSASSSRWNA